MVKNSTRDKIRKANEGHRISNEKQLNERLIALTAHEKEDDNPIHDLIVAPEEILKTSNEIEVKIIDKEEVIQAKDNDSNTENLSSLQDRFGVRKIFKPVKDAQLTARIDSLTLKRFKDIVKKMYYPDKPNINETVTQIIRAFVEEYDKTHNEG